MSEGGLGVRNLGAFNKALLGKWVWRFNNDKNNLWTKVVKSRYGDLVWGRDGEVTEGRRKRRSGWWKNVIATVDGGDGKWFWDNVEVKLGGGAETRFWDGFWSGNQNLKQLYPRLFQLCQNKHSRVADMGSWEGGVWRWRIEWRRPLRECERAGEAGLFNLLQQYNLREGETDKWIWRGTRDGIYSVKEAYKAISKRDLLLQSEIASSTMFTGVWKARAPFKAKISAWRLLRDRLPTKDNLIKSYIAIQSDAFCCKKEPESVAHFFFKCQETSQLRYNMVKWIGSSWATPDEVTNHHICFSSLLGKGKIQHRLYGLWICVIWVLWKWRNSVVFQGVVWDMKRIEVEIKCRFWSWCVVNEEADPCI